MSSTETKAVMEQIVRRVAALQSDNWSLKLDHWEWNAGVCLYGIMKAYESTGQELYFNMIRDWCDRNVRNRKFGSVNTVIPANAVLLMFQRTGDNGYLEICKEYADWCLHEALKTSNGGFAHVWSEGGKEDYKNQLWIDSLFMACLFMIRYGTLIGDKILVQAAKEQFNIHMDCQFDPKASLFYHGYHCITKEVLGERWGRGNGWAAASLVELLERMNPEDSSIHRYRDVFKSLMDKGYRLRLDDGLLRTLPEDETAYPESTAAALFGYAAIKGARMGLLDKRFEAWGQQIVDTLIGYFKEEGTIRFASGGTDCQDREGYLKVPYAETLYAYGILLMLFSESLEAVPRV